MSREFTNELLAEGFSQGRLFVDCMSQLRRAIERTQIELPDGQLTHVLRHTFASHFVMNGGDIFTLQKYWVTRR